MWRQYFFQSADWKSAPVPISIIPYPHWALGSADSPYHGRTQNSPWSVVLHHPLFPPSPSSVISFPQILLSDSHSLGVFIYYFTNFSRVTFLFLWASTRNYQKSTVWLPYFPLLFSACSLSLLLSKRKPLCCQRERAPSLMLDFKLSRYQVSIRKHSYRDSRIQSASIYSQTF